MVRTIYLQQRQYRQFTTMSFYSLKQVASITANKAQDLTEEVIDAGRQVYCSLYKNHPFWTIPRTFKDSNLIFRALNDFCQEQNFVPPPPPTIPYTGGQCPTSYRILASCEVELWIWTNFTFESLGVVYPSVDTVDVAPPLSGPIGTVSFVSSPPCPSPDPDQVNCTYGGRDMYFIVNDATGQRAFRMKYYTTGPFQGGVITPSSQNFARRDTIANRTANVSRLDGLPDTCGDPPPGYPPEPTPSDVDITNISVDVTNSNNVTNTYNVSINRDGDNYIGFSPTLNVSGIGLSLDVTGINIGGGVSTFTPSGQSQQDQDELPNGVREPEPLPEPEPEPEPELITQPGSVEETVPRIYAVTVNFTSIPVNAKIASGGAAPRIIYGGWVEFKRGSDYLPRQFIDFDDSVFLAPTGATGYAVTIKQGYTASISKTYYSE